MVQKSLLYSVHCAVREELVFSLKELSTCNQKGDKCSTAPKLGSSRSFQTDCSATTDNSRNAVRQDASHAEQAAEASRLTSALSPPWLPEPVDQKKQASCCLAPGRG